jgi:predicted transcriptional regulator of viral defense system
MDLYQKIRRSVKLRKTRVFIRKDFADFEASDAQLSRVLARLVSEGVLVKIGKGVYAKAKTSVRTGKAIPIATIDELIPEALDKLGISYTLGSAALEYVEGRTTQIPMALRVKTSSRNRRKLGFGNRFLTYEDD